MVTWDEQVLVFPHCGLSKLGMFPGLVTAAESLATLMCEILPNSRYMSRKDVEDDPTSQQIIPYIVCKDGDRILVYNRGGNGGEGRLAGSWSIGIGGHINPVDDEGSRAHALHHAAVRELAEELGSDTPPHLEYMGVLKSDNSIVDLVHMGVVFTATFDNIEDIRGSCEIERYRWVTLGALNGYKLESWSEIVRDHLNKNGDPQ